MHFLTKFRKMILCISKIDSKSNFLHKTLPGFDSFPQYSTILARENCGKLSNKKRDASNDFIARVFLKICEGELRLYRLIEP